jgi:UDP-N-acetyl-2-amino-2-deoxyglucuronate dehydrogenase
MQNFGLIGAAGYIAPRHMQAIHDTNNRLVAAVDAHDCVGRIDSYFPDAEFFTAIEQFERLLEQRNLGSDAQRVNYVSICTPNYLHDAHIRLALRSQSHAICEKPLVLSPYDLDAISELEEAHGGRVYNVLQLRLIEKLQKLRKELFSSSSGEKKDIVLSYVTRRGSWYDVSWKGDPKKSGGPSMNIGVHFFDLLLWLFGEAEHAELHLRETRRMSGYLELERARVRWFLSVDEADLPKAVKESGKFAYRSMTMDDQELEFSDGFTNLHTRSYEEILAGNGFGICEARPAIELVHRINSLDIQHTGTIHPKLKAGLPIPKIPHSKVA